MRSVKILMLLVEVVVHCIQRRRRRPFQQNEGHTKAAFLPTTYIVLYSRSISCCWNILSAVVTAFFLQYSATLLLSAKLGGPVSPSLKVWRTTTKTKQPLKKDKEIVSLPSLMTKKNLVKMTHLPNWLFCSLRIDTGKNHFWFFYYNHKLEFT